MIPSDLSIARGEIWDIRFDPSEGDEIRRIRPAVILSPATVGRMKLRIVVPVTGWQPSFSRYFWMVHLTPSAANRLSKESAADCFQVKSVSVGRFQRRLGSLTATDMDEIAAAVALCIRYHS